jgi:hypothetical protein
MVRMLDLQHSRILQWRSVVFGCTGHALWATCPAGQLPWVMADLNTVMLHAGHLMISKNVVGFDGACVLP